MPLPIWWELGAGGAPAPGCGHCVGLSVSALSESEEAGEELGPALRARAPLRISVARALQREAVPQPQGRRQRGPQHRLCLHCQELSHWRSPSRPPEPRRTLWSTQ